MLTLSTDASDIVRTAILNSPDVPDETGGVRLYVADTTNGQGQMAAAIVDAPEPDDLVIDDAGARVFVDPDLTPHVSEKELDAETREDGRISLRLEDRS